MGKDLRDIGEGKRRQITVGVIGAGMISDIYLTNMTQHFPLLSVKSICSGHMEHARAQAEKYGLTAVTREEMLLDPEIELVVILTPVETHYELIKSALLAGKHVYTEKTLTDRLETARELVDLAKERGLMFGSAPDTFLGEAYQTAFKAIEEGLIGEVNSFSITCNRSNDVILPLYPNNRIPGNGVLYDYLVYYITALVSLLGPVKELVGITSNPYPERVNAVPISKDYGETIHSMNESIVEAIVTLRSGISGTVHLNAESAATDLANVRIFGRRGILALTDANRFRGEVKYVPFLNDYEDPQPKMILNPSTRSLENARGIGPADLAEAILEGRDCRPNADLAYHVMEVLTAIRDSNGKMVEIQSTCRRPEPFPTKDPGVRQLAHAAFQLKNSDEMMHFYEDILGMPRVFDLTFQEFYDSIRNDRPEDFTEEGYRKLDEGERRWLEGIQKQAEMGKTWLRYLKVSERQFLEFFFDDGTERRTIRDRWNHYGYTKLNLVVEDLKQLERRLTENGVAIDRDVHQTADGLTGIRVYDPDGNLIEFTGSTRDTGRTELTDLTLQVRDDVNMRRFYADGLGLKPVRTLKAEDLAKIMEKMPDADPEKITELRMQLDAPWMEYLEAGPNEYIVLLHTMGQEKQEERDLSDACGYMHLCLEVEDIQAAYDAVIANGIIPDTEISMGADFTWQFWMTDPDGNRLEMHQYTEKSMQLKG